MDEARGCRADEHDAAPQAFADEILEQRILGSCDAQIDDLRLRIECGGQGAGDGEGIASG